MAGVGPVAQSGIAWPTPRPPAVRSPGPRPEPAAGAGSKEEADALIILTVLEGRDLQDARQRLAELREGAAAEPEHRVADADPESPRGTGEASIRVDVEVQAVHVEVRTADLQVTVDAVQARVGVQAQVRAARPKDPLVLDLDGSGPRTTGAAGAVEFDLAGDGVARPTSWVDGATAFLALDRNGNGRIDHGGELFGDQHGAVDGYEELQKFDADGNGVIDPRDPVFRDLLLLDRSGTTRSLGGSGVVSLGLDAGQGGNPTTTGGDAILRQASARTVDGRRFGTYALGLATFEALG